MGMIIMNGKEYVGSGGGGSLTMLNNTTITSLNTPVSLADDITNYDLILVHAYYTGGEHPLIAAQAFVPSQLIAHNRQTWLVGGNADRMMSITFPTNTTIQIVNSNGSNGIQGIYGIKFYGNSNTDRHDYSTTEHVIGTWIDGKPLYEKVISGTYSYNTDNMGDFYVGYLNFSSIIPNIDMAWVDVNKSYYTVGTASRGFIAGWYQKDSNEFMLMTRFSRSNVPSVIVIQYTKTTD